MDGRQTPARCRGFENTLVLTMRDRRVACCPCFETLASLAPQHEVVVFQQARPHPEEAANGSRECAPDGRLRAVSKDRLQYRFVIPGTRVYPPRLAPVAVNVDPLGSCMAGALADSLMAAA